VRKIVIAVMGTLSALVLVVAFDASRRDGGPVTTAEPPAGRRDDSPPNDSGTPPTGGDAGSSPSPRSSSTPRSSPSPSSSSTPRSSPTPQASSRRPASTSGTFTGDAIQTRWGIVQVRIEVRNGKITQATAIQYPQENRHDQEINSRAVPQLEQATVSRNGQVDSVSGATVTSGGYQKSLQSALDQAHL
jgi:uncharacterized protein with FMN-binding domain